MLHIYAGMRIYRGSAIFRGFYAEKMTFVVDPDPRSFFFYKCRGGGTSGGSMIGSNQRLVGPGNTSSAQLDIKSHGHHCRNDFLNE